MIVAACAGLAVHIALAQAELRPLPPLMRALSDEVGALSRDQGAKLSRALQEILDEDGIRMVVVIAESVGPEPIEDYAQRLSRRWARDRGIDPTRAIFIIVAVKDRDMVVMPGRALGLEAALSRPEFGRDLAPLFREQRYFEALMTLTDRVHGVIHSAATGRPAQ